jgi:hypothetical protein
MRAAFHRLLWPGTRHGSVRITAVRVHRDIENGPATSSCRPVDFLRRLLEFPGFRGHFYSYVKVNEVKSAQEKETRDVRRKYEYIKANQEIG